AELVVAPGRWAGGQLVFPVTPLVQERVGQGAPGVLARPARAAGDGQYGAGCGAPGSAPTGVTASVDQPCLAPWPPASVPWATMTSAPTSSACLASSRLVTWMISAVPDARTGPASGRGSPKDSITAAGRAASASSTVAAS